MLTESFSNLSVGRHCDVYVWGWGFYDRELINDALRTFTGVCVEEKVPLSWLETSL
jgi:hypothetical protein